MEGEARYTYVGLAMIALVAALVASIIWLNHTGSRGEFGYYTISFQHQPLDGLQIGSDVTVRGIKVGRVEHYELAPENIHRVRVIIRVSHDTRLSNDMVAGVTRNLLTGIAYVSLESPDPPGPPLALVTTREGPLPEIAESEGRADLAEMAAETMRRLNDVLRPENREALSATLVNVRDLTAGLNARVGAIDHSLAAFDRSLGAIDGAARELGHAGARTASLAGSTERELVPAIRQANQTMTDISATALTIRTETSTLAQRVGQTAGSTDDQLTMAASQLRTAVEAIDRMLERLRDPRAALFGPDRAQRGPGE